MALFEASPNVHSGLKGEWLHPPSLRTLEHIGVRIGTQAHATKGFMVFPEDGSEPITLTYPEGSHGMVCPHETLALRLREVASNEPNVDLIWRRAHPFHDGSIKYTQNGIEESVTADRVVGADGLGSVVLRLLGLTTKPTVCSRMIGVRMDGVALPMKDYGHIICTELGPIFMYSLGEESVSALVDIPREYSSHHATDLLLSFCVPRLPADIKPFFLEALHKGRFKLSGNTIRPRISYGNPRFVVIGDAVGHYHPMTAVGLTLGFGDAMALAECEDFNDFIARRFEEIRAPEILAMGFYEVFADHRAETMALRHAVYEIWRKGGKNADRSVRLLACEDTSGTSLGFAAAAAVALTVWKTIPRSMSPRAWRRAGSIIHRLTFRLGWLMRAVWQLRKSRAAGEIQNEQFYANLARALLTSVPQDRHSKPHD